MYKDENLFLLKKFLGCLLDDVSLLLGCWLASFKVLYEIDIQ